jgi:hypothetical protein
MLNPPRRIRCLTGAAFASLKKCPLEADFFNHAFGVTESAAADAL